LLRVFLGQKENKALSKSRKKTKHLAKRETKTKHLAGLAALPCVVKKHAVPEPLR
jgi:hypothetical protein